MLDASPMATNEVQVSVRLPADVPTRADELAATLAEAPAYLGFRVSRAAVLRMAMLRGLDALEAEAAEATKGKGAK